MVIDSSEKKKVQTRFRVAVNIASIGRNSLCKTVKSIADQVLDGRLDVVLFIADDSQEGKVSKLAAVFPAELETTILVSSAKNISVARNVCLDVSTNFDFVAFIDDDEIADANWIINAIEDMNSQRLDVLFGHVYPLFSPGVPEEVVRSGVYVKMPDKLFGPLLTGATSNAFARMSVIKRGGVRFDPRFGRTGGEDSDFFWRLRKSGAVLGASKRVVVYEFIDSDRFAISSIKRRYKRGGHTTAVLELSSGRSKFLYLFDAVVKLIYFMLNSWLVVPFSKSVSLKFKVRYWATIGKIEAILGSKAVELYS